ncbi:putative polysaccharide biosynthesis protein [Fusibacillus kribbianus]|uniref:Polysaccharide biosynthesis protein n=1 Tax=Fusibacillus kribbianus TaxID=3044208 RepID=A0AAP4BAP4_9FIRM|nr:polysaccharide biosynthesis protein [Ruminococcus sp. YH-rum2234]MDI9242585.1 polysaccharide biosynthesis protein [Ruminococcus sp. YH-rum2234]
MSTQNQQKKKKKKSSNFLIQGSILAVAGILVRIIGMVYRIPMQNKIGNAAMGMYSSAFYIYNIILLLSSYSLPLAVSKMVSARVALGQHKNAYRIFQSSMIFSLISGSVAGLLMFFGADFFAVKLLNEPGAAYAIKVLAPTVFVMAFLGTLRGYFQGLGTMIPTAVSQVLEQIINAVISIVAAFLLFDMGARVDIAKGTDIYADAYGAAGGTLGTAAGALTALIFCFVLFRMYRRILKRQMRRDNTVMLESYGNIARVLVATIVPVIISGTVYNVSNLVDNSIYGFYMKSVGESAHYMAKWGVYSGQYYLLINVPIAISNALSSSMLPSLTRTVTEGNKGEVLRKINMTIRFSMIVAIPSAVGLTLLGAPIVEMLFNQDTKLGGDLLFLGSLAVIFFSLSTVTNGVLQGINKMKTPVRNALISLILHVGILVALLYGLKTGIYGVVIANMLFGLSMCILNGISIANYLNYRQEVKKTFVLPFLASLIMGGCSYLVYYLLNMLTKRNSIACLAAVIVAVAVYFVMLIVFRCVDEKELHSMPMGGKMVRIAKKLRLM